MALPALPPENSTAWYTWIAALDAAVRSGVDLYKPQVTDIAATGTRGSTTFLRGDGVWSTITLTPTFAKRTITGPYTVAAADAVDTVLHVTAATAVTITVPADADAVIPLETVIPWRQYGDGQITFAQGTGANLVSRGAVFNSAAKYAEGLITKVAANTWLLSGDIS